MRRVGTLVGMASLLAVLVTGCSNYRSPTSGSAPPNQWGGELVQTTLEVKGLSPSASAFQAASIGGTSSDELRAYIRVVSATDYSTISEFPKDIPYDPVNGAAIEVPIATGADYIASVIVHEGDKLIALDMDRAFVPEGSPPDLITLEPHEPTYTATIPQSVRRTDEITPHLICARSNDPMILGSVAVLIGWREWDNNGDERDHGTNDMDVKWTIENCINYGPDTFEQVPPDATELYYQIRITNQRSYGGGTFYAAYDPDLDVAPGLPTIAIEP